ncbi:P-loop containing nucleoside triphosphate hydrolase protein [Naematelia encephala]|uniref:RNA helicase n=1 Tax=Naematelia encephala TaxID=71784 RepID=A0A1Y2AYC0_9TREE|nr:P-loop containing nucleoside triphosphate hydrolase protein [Naematelia encephala]
MDRSQGTAPAFGGSWSKLSPPLTPSILEAVHSMGFTNMTPVQAGTIPRAMKNQDCVVEAVTGSGKTIAFVIPVLERIIRRETPYSKGQVAAIIIAPTRELAQQIHDVFYRFITSLNPTVEPASPIASSSRSPTPPPTSSLPLPLLVTSGTKNPYDTFLSQSSNILIGTPGRLASFLLSPRGASLVRVSDFDVLVLDEADRLLSSPDHRRDVERIMSHLPKQRRTHLFSATMTDAVEEMVGLGLRNPVRIVVNLKDKRAGEEAKERRVPTSLQNNYIVCRHAEKTLQLVRLLQYESTSSEAARFIVYFSTCAAVDYFYRILSRLPPLSSFNLTSLHGDLPPRVRETALSAFTDHPASHLSPAVLLCTDVAARGVDFADIDVVVQYDPPTDPKTFSHRAGRSARAGKRGKAVVLLGRGREEDYVEFLAVRKIPLDRQAYLDHQLKQVDDAPETATIDPAALELLCDIREIVLTDRELADKAAKAFVSSLRAYSKHEASFIFRVADVDFGELGVAYGLLRLPAMPEIKEWRRKRAAVDSSEHTAFEWKDAEVDWNNFKYASKAREVQRLAAIASKANNDHDKSAATLALEDEERKKRKIRAEMREAWSDKKDRKTRKEDRRTRKDKRKAAEWEKSQLEGIGDLGLVEAFKRKKGLNDPTDAVKDKEKEKDDGEMDKEYETLKKEVKEERAAKKVRKDAAIQGGLGGGAFGDLD